MVSGCQPCGVSFACILTSLDCDSLDNGHFMSMVAAVWWQFPLNAPVNTTNVQFRCKARN